METLKKRFHERIRNQLANLLIFGSLILSGGGGLVLGCILGVVFSNQVPDHAYSPALKLAITVGTTAAGFIGGTLLGLFISPLVLRFAFFAKPLTTWKGMRVFSAADSDLPGGLPNVFVAGFSSGFGPFQPIIFASEGALRALSSPALEAVFAHEASHLKCSHLLRRYAHASGTFLLSSLFVSAAIVGASLSGYAKPSGVLPLLAAAVPALLTWLTIRNSLWKQELEADEVAIHTFAVSPGALLEALETLQSEIDARTQSKRTLHPLVAHRMEILRILAAEEDHLWTSSTTSISAAA